MIKALNKLIKRRNKRYYEASDILTRQEKMNLMLIFSVIVIPFIIGLAVYVIG